MQQSKSKGSICRGRETIVTAAKSKASIYREKREASLLQQIKGFNLRREREPDILAAANQKVQSAKWGKQLLLQQNQMVQSAEGERQTYFLRQTQKVQSTEEEKHTHTHTYILVATKQNLQSAEGERNSCLLLQQNKASICEDQHSIAMKRARSKSCGTTICHLAGCSNNLIRFVGCCRYPHHLPSSSLAFFFISTLGKSKDRSPASCWRQRWSFLSTSKTLTILRYIENRENKNGSDDDPN